MNAKTTGWVAWLLLAGMIACSSKGEESSTTVAQGACGAVQEWTQRCAEKKSACDDALVSDCSKVEALISPAVMGAADTCIRAADCETAPLRCLRTAVSSAQPTEAQKDLAKAYCETCIKKEVAKCEAAFFGGEGGKGVGLALLPFGDGIIGEAKSKCTGKLGCAATFSACAQGVASKALTAALPAETAKCIVKGLLDDSPPEDGGTDGSTDGGEDTSVEDTSVTDTSVEDTGSSDTSVTDTSVGDTGDTGTCTGADPEPNDTEGTARVLKGIDDCDGEGSTFSGVIASASDVDYVKYAGKDSIGCSVNPSVKTTSAVEVCLYAKCSGGSTTTFKSCSKGTMRTIGAQKMCCTSSSSTEAQLSFTCSGIDDSATVFMRVARPTATSCTPYSVSYHY